MVLVASFWKIADALRCTRETFSAAIASMVPRLFFLKDNELAGARSPHLGFSTASRFFAAWFVRRSEGCVGLHHRAGRRATALRQASVECAAVVRTTTKAPRSADRLAEAALGHLLRSKKEPF